MKQTLAMFAIAFLLTACNLGSTPPAPAPVSLTPDNPAPVISDTPLPDTSTPVTPTLTFTPSPTFTATSTPTVAPPATVESLKATVADLLSCRYGPGSEYLYLIAFNRTTPVTLIGQTGGNNWVLVENKSPCWVNTKFLDIEGDPKTLKVVYPEGYRLPVSPYYSPPAVLSASRDGSSVTVEWTEIALRPGDEEDENMFLYIIEVWRCEDGQMIFDPLYSNNPQISFVDESGCATPSHGRVYFQEKHGYAGPAEIPWP